MFIQFNLSTYSNSCSVRLPVSNSSHGSYIVASVISYYSCMQQGVDRHPCLVTIYSMFTDTVQEVLAPTVSTHNRHQLSHQLSVVTASTETTQSCYLVKRLKRLEEESSLAPSMKRRLRIVLPRGQRMYSLQSGSTTLSFRIPLRLGRVNYISTQA